MERDSIVRDLAKASGKLSAQTVQIEALERRALSADTNEIPNSCGFKY